VKGALLRGLGATALVAACAPAATESQGRETPDQVRRIIAQAICLAEAYPGTAIASDSAGIVSVYQGTLGSVAARDIAAVRAMARDARPSQPTPVGDRNFAIARCVLFAERADVLMALGMSGPGLVGAAFRRPDPADAKATTCPAPANTLAHVERWR
jgi:hypothetical protein